MRIFTTLICTLFLALTVSAQVVLVNSPASIAGSKAFDAAAFGADLTSGTWTGDVVFVNDGSANPTQGCEAATNAAELAGKIALIDRGTCEFGLKCLNAENAGAIAVVVFNSVANAGLGTIPMGAGVNGAAVTIPAVMLSYEEGQTIRTTMMTETVNMTIGNVVFENDLALTAKRLSNMVNGVMPVNQAEALGVGFTPGVNVLNKGLNGATSIQAEGVITHTPAGGSATLVYDEVNSLASLAKDSSGFIQLADYTPTEGAGVYDITYSVSSSEGDSPEAVSDNEFTSQFVFSSNVYCRGRWDFTNNRPISSIGRTVGGGGSVEFLAGFEVPEGAGYKLDSIQFQIFPQTGTLGGLEANSVTGYVYEWDDLNSDEGITNDELTIVGYAPVTFADTSATSAWVKADIYDYLELEPGGYVVPGDNKRYFLGVRYEGSAIVFFGFDDGYDQTVAMDNGLIQRDFDLPYIVITAWDNSVPDIEGGGLFTDVGGAIASALIINQYDSPSIEVAPSNVAVTLSPNPANNQLVVESKLKSATGGISYTIRDNAGRMVYNSSKTLNTDYDKASFNVSQFAAGQYFIVVTTDQGIKAERFTVQH
ncbi:MAG: T9SS type A sorting domain-containing protein [Saprospiraceae bacterium]|nr:T9SS type A sorting domain-containing protein [Saprospiraceae bacterium]MCF8249645.1 T9SS type A sorting domain-containing protein [Saprospiraceae bacterium]MCF8280455.1 T9SS type A sorting domain-containing protein [Bacteroidales bacterium]MCF8310477.1 T9SS type A sorting domain-containing protein [Saprospiraceae bacterium]MCF8439855.1 T9SS type A sorting domain-containing protein [Saprospiraceae bacterium]